MKILIAHNHYGDFAVGGEAGVMTAETDLLRSHGHNVEVYERSNSEIERGTLFEKLRAGARASWSAAAQQDIGQILKRARPDVMHVHNYWLVLTPSIFETAKKHGIATVLTLHNYRVICPGGQFQRNGKPCELCLDGRVGRALWHRCHPGKSLLKTWLKLRLDKETRRRGFLAGYVDRYIALTQFARSKFLAGGLPEDQVVCKPNFVHDPLVNADNPPPHANPYAVCVSRLSPEKGVGELVRAWREIGMPLKIVGDGPQRAELEALASDEVEFAGAVPREQVFEIVRNSEIFVFPSTLYEGFPLAMLEAMACGRAVIASDLGPRREILDNGRCGLLYTSQDNADLRDKIRRLVARPQLRVELGAAARQKYLEFFSAEVNYRQLMEIYRQAITHSQNSTFV